MKPKHLTKVKSFHDGHTYFYDVHGSMWLTDLAFEDYHKVITTGFITFNVHDRFFAIPLEGSKTTLITLEEALFLSNDGMRFDPNNDLVKAIKQEVKKDLERYLTMNVG
jgi:hypothetical protein